MAQHISGDASRPCHSVFGRCRAGRARGLRSVCWL